MSVAVYLRVSTSRQETDSQRTRITTWLKTKGLAADHWFEDIISATKKELKERPGFRQMQAAIASGQVNHVVVFALDRIARNMVDGLLQIDQWQKAGVRLTSVVEDIDLDLGNWLIGGAIVKIMVAMRLAIAEEETERRGMRVRAGKAAAQEKWSLAKEMVEAGKGLQEVADYFGVNLARATKMSTGKLPSGALTQSMVDPVRLKAFREQGFSTSECARIFGVTKRRIITLCKRIKMSGVHKKPIKNRSQVVNGLANGERIRQHARAQLPLPL